MREHVCRIHHLFCMSEESVPEYVFKWVQLRRSRTLFFKSCAYNANFHIRHLFFVIEESVSESVF